jgi:tripartite-type tricarboxylate transporter receptor subunit TctC
MIISRAAASLSLALGLAFNVCQANNFPDKPVKVVVPAAPGGISDSISRVVSAELQNALGKPVVVENIPGASGNIGTSRGLNAKPDGYTLTGLTTVQTASMATRPSTSADILALGEPVMMMSRSCLVLVVPASLGIKTLPEFIEYAKAHRGQISYGSPGVGSGYHIMGELLNAVAGLEMVHIAYKGEQPATTDLLGGRIQAMFHTTPYQYIESGQMIPLAVTSEQPWPMAPNVPTLSSYFPGAKYYGWSALYAPKDTPKEIIDVLNAAGNKALQTEKVKAGLKALGVAPAGGSPKDLLDQVHADVATFRDVVRKQNIVVAE